MAEKKQPYKKIRGMTGSASLFSGKNMGRHSLWLGEDHILSVQFSGFHERYHRFFFKDIHAVLWRKTYRFWIWLGVILLVNLLGVLTFLGGDDPQTLFRASFLLVCGLPALIIHLVKGPTCALYIKTGVQELRIYAVKRVKKAHRLIALLESAIQDAQKPVS